MIMEAPAISKRKGTVLVTDADRGSALAIIRSLGRAGWNVIAADSVDRSLGSRSRYASASVRYPHPRTSPERFADRLLWAVRRHEVDLIVPVTDDVIQILAHNRARFKGTCRLAMAGPKALTTVADKAKTVRLARRLGVPTPRTAIVESFDEALRAAADFRWPVVIKAGLSPRYDPARGRFERWPVRYARDPQEFVAALREFNTCPRFLIQEYCEGVGQGVEMLAYRGRVISAFQHRRLAEIPVTGGASAWRESVPLDDTLFDYAERLVRSLRWTGLIMVEFKGGARRGRLRGSEPRLMEINGRVWGSLPLAVHSGMDFPARLAELYREQPELSAAGPDSRYDVGVRAFNLELILLWIPQVLLGRARHPFLPRPRRFEAVSAAWDLLMPRRRRFDVASRDDPKPGYAEIRKIAAKLGRKLRGGKEAAR